MAFLQGICGRMALRELFVRLHSSDSRFFKGVLVVSADNDSPLKRYTYVFYRSCGVLRAPHNKIAPFRGLGSSPIGGRETNAGISCNGELQS